MIHPNTGNPKEPRSSTREPYRWSIAASVLLLALPASCHDGERRAQVQVQVQGEDDAALKQLQQSRIETACTMAASLLSASERHMVVSLGKCPHSVDDLVASESISQADPDPWDTPFDIRCPTENGIEIRSGGPDGQLYSADDIVLGPPDSDCQLPATE